MIGIIGLAIVLGRTATIVLFAVISYIALKEYFSIVPTRRTDRLILLLAYLAVPVQYYWVGIAWYGASIDPVGTSRSIGKYIRCTAATIASTTRSRNRGATSRPRSAGEVR